MANHRDFPSTAVAIARQCGIIENEKVDDFTALTSDLNAPVKEYNPDDPHRICNSIVLSGKDMTEMKDAQWEQVAFTIFGANCSYVSTKRSCLPGPRRSRNYGL